MLARRVVLEETSAGTAAKASLLGATESKSSSVPTFFL